MWRMKLQSHKLVHAFLLTDTQPPILDTMLERWNAAHWTAWYTLGRQGTLDEHKVKSLVPTFTFTPSTQLLHALAYHKARMALVYFQSSPGPHKIQSDKELDIQVWLTPPSFSLLLPADCLNTRFLGVPRLCAVSDHPLYIFVYMCVNYTLWRLGASLVGANCRFFRYSPLELITLQSSIISIILEYT